MAVSIVRFPGGIVRLDYPAFKARFKQLKRLTSYQRCNLRAEEKKATHYQRAAAAVMEHAFTHTPDDYYSSVDDNGNETTLRYENWAGESGELDLRKVAVAASSDWWRSHDWDQKIDAISRGYYQVDKRVLPLEDLSRPVERMVMGAMAGQDDIENFVIIPGYSIDVIVSDFYFD